MPPGRSRHPPAIGAAAKGKKTNSHTKEENKAWFKIEELGERLGWLLIDCWGQIAGTQLGAELWDLYTFTYGEELP